jgi:O-antigen ligase
MIRLGLLTVFCTVLALYAWKDWYKSLCGLVVMMAIIEHPDMPKTIMGIQGLNPWNIVFLCVLGGWILQRGREGLTWDFPKPVFVLLVLYMGVVVTSAVRLILDPGTLAYTTGQIVSEYLVNTLKWIIPGLLLFDGCRDMKRFKFALGSILLMYLLLSIQVIRWMPLEAATGNGEELAARSLKILMNEIGYHRVTMSMMLAGASWAIFASMPIAKTAGRRVLVLVLVLVTMYAQALTAGRAGYLTWAAVGFILCVIRWRKYLVLMPLVVLLVALLMPGVVQRLSVGFNDSPVVGTQTDEYTLTAGRNIAWKHVIKKIHEGPMLGFGRLAIQRTGVSDAIFNECNDFFAHPHNAYLEMLLENGVVGLSLVLPFYIVVLSMAMRLFRDSRNPAFVAMGGVSCSLILALLIASATSQSFYPIEGTAGMWAAIGLTIRIWVERRKALAHTVPVRRFGDIEAPLEIWTEAPVDIDRWGRPTRKADKLQWEHAL